MAFTNTIQKDPEGGRREFYLDEKSTSQSAVSTVAFSPSSKPARRQFFTMRTGLKFIAVATFLSIAYASAITHSQHHSPPHGSDVQSQHDQVNFDNILAQVSDQSLHEVLHKYVTFKYKHGVYREDRNAVQAIHQDSPAIATSLVELARRQAQNATTTTTPPVIPTTTPVVVPTSTPSEVSTSQQPQPTTTSAPTTSQAVSPTSPPTPTVASTSAAAGEPSVETSTTSQANPTTPQSSAGPSTTPVQTTPQDTTTAPSPGPSPTTPTTGTTSSAAGGGNNANSDTTEAPTPVATTSGLKSQQVVYTTTLPNGARSTVTYVTVIPANSQASTPGVTATGIPTLQNVAGKFDKKAWVVGAGAIAFAIAL